MIGRRIGSALVATAAAVGTMSVAVPDASAHVVCSDGSGDSYRVTAHNYQFVEVDEISLVNHRSGSATLSSQVGETHTDTRSFTGTISASVEGGFWVFAKASASTSASKTIQTSSTMSKTYTATATVPGHSSRTVKFGFRRYNQYIQEYYLYNTSATTCGVKVVRAGWVRAPYAKAFVID